MRRRFCEKGEVLEGVGLVGWASITGGGVGGVALSKAKACGVREETSKAAKVACEGIDFKESEMGCFLLRIA